MTIDPQRMKKIYKTKLDLFFTFLFSIAIILIGTRGNLFSDLFKYPLDFFFYFFEIGIFVFHTYKMRSKPTSWFPIVESVMIYILLATSVDGHSGDWGHSVSLGEKLLRIVKTIAMGFNLFIVPLVLGYIHEICQRYISKINIKFIPIDDEENQIEEEEIIGPQ